MTTSPAPKHSNRLVHETSPYLLQHAHNPVDWHPWGPEALTRARDEDKPIFLSIGYSACHWCHVMERESFENEDIAAFMNEHFVNIKVDREERPDLDDVYMKATQILSGHGGWPMSVFLTPELDPFYAGTYFPVVQRHGLPTFQHVLAQLHGAWTNNRDAVVTQGRKVVERVRQLSLSGEHLPALGPQVTRPRLDLVDTAMEQLGRLFDPGDGGFGGPPKFPHADDIRLCLRQHVLTGDGHALHMAVHTLDCMMRGGIHDQLGGGFARYSTDGEWAVPHFEKMLYDNALLVPAYLEAHRITGREDFAAVARGCCDWVLREMVDPSGGLWSTQDADSEGEEGRFFVWTRKEIHGLVARGDRELVDAYYRLDGSPNFEGHAWVLVRPHADTEIAERFGLSLDALRARIDAVRATLYAAREKRVRPGTDDKVLVAWNGLMIGALARAGALLDEPRYLDAARAAAHYCLTAMRPDGRRLLATSRAGKAHLNGTLADYAYLAEGLLELFEADGDPRWPTEALSLVDVVRERFADGERAGFFFTSDDHETLVARPRDLFDGALPSSNGVMADVLVRLADLTGDGALLTEADRLFAMAETLVRGAPSAFARLLLALVRADDARTVVVSSGDGAAALLRAARRQPDASVTVLPASAAGVDAETERRLPILSGKDARAGRAAAYVCRHGTCAAPVTEVGALLSALRE